MTLLRSCSLWCVLLYVLLYSGAVFYRQPINDWLVEQMSLF
jgi:hypothetical protein